MVFIYDIIPRSSVPGRKASLAANDRLHAGRRRKFVFCFAAIGFSAFMMGEGAAKPIPGLKCDVETTEVGSVTIGNINKAPNINNILSFSCNFRRPLGPGRRVAYCWHIHDSSAGTKKFTYRYAELDKKNEIGFNIYAHEQRVGDRRNEYNVIGLARKITDTYYRVDDPIMIRFEGNEGISSLAPGQYKYNNPQTHVVMHDISDYDTIDYKNACGAANGDVIGTGNKKGNTNITINVRTYCDVRVGQDLIFPKQYSLAQPLKATGTVNVNCSAGTDYRVEINRGNSYFDNMRHMKRRGGKETIAYQISPEQWTGIGLGTRQGQDITVDGTVPVQPVSSAGVYRDTLIVTVNIVR